MSDQSTIDATITEASQMLRSQPHQSIALTKTLVVNKLLTPEQNVRAHLILSRAYIHIGDYAAGEPIARNALKIAQEAGLRDAEGRAHNEVGIFRFVSGDFNSALNHYDAAEHLLREHHLKSELARVYINMANVFNRSNQHVRAITFYEKALHLAEQVGDDLTQAKVYGNLAGLYYHVVYDPETADDHAEKAIEVYRRLGDTVGLAKGLVNRAGHKLVMRQHDEAIALYEEALEMRREFSEPTDLMMTYDGLVTALLHVGRTEEAHAIAATALSDPHILTPDTDAYSNIIRARVAISNGKYEEAIPILENIYDVSKSQDDVETTRLLRELLANACRLSGAWQRAAELFYEMIVDSKEDTRSKASQSLSRIKAELDIAKAEARAELERTKNEELATMLRDLETIHKENEEYISILAHELKSPLSTIKSIASMLAGTNELPESERIDFSQEIQAISTRMLDMVVKTLDAAKQRARPVATPVDARAPWEFVLRTSSALANSKGQHIEYTIASEPLMVAATEQQLTLILENLISNALKFSPVESAVVVSARRRKYGRGSDRIVVRVTDQGPGLSREDQRALFDAYEQLTPKPTGSESSTGLGLHLVKKTVDRLGGRIWCESMVGKGASFFVELPVVEL